MNRRAFTTGRMDASANDDLSMPGRRLMKYAIALGSNIGNRVEWIEKACHEMEAAGLQILATSGLFSTSAMYVTDQDDFLNGACIIQTDLQPIELMKTLQGIEQKLGRVKVIDKGPRNIDLDVLLWEGGEFHSDQPDLHIPHKLMHERDFVLLPLSQLLPAATKKISDTMLQQLSEEQRSKILGRLNHSTDRISTSKSNSITIHTSLRNSLPPLKPWRADKQTHVMAILNLTDDSFSDGGSHKPSDQAYLRSKILEFLHAGATIIDLGAQSSRPQAPDIAAGDEINRLMPALHVLRDLRQQDGILDVPPFAVSVDTYRADVAEAAVNAGADIINDISAGLLDSRMLATIARLGCPYVMMHMRGTPHTMTSKENTTYHDELIDVIKDELVDRIAAAEEAGIRRWKIILDPGIGFAKTAKQNLQILRELGRLTGPGHHTKIRGKMINGVWRTLEGTPWLVGASRKGFIGTITGVGEAKDRSWGTAATVTAAIAGGADIVRVHDVKEMVQVARMSDAIYRMRVPKFPTI